MTIEEQIQAEFDAILKADTIEAEKQSANIKIEGDFSGLRKFIDKGVKYKIEEIVVVGCNPYGI